MKPILRFLLLCTLIGLFIFSARYFAVDPKVIDQYLKQIPLLPACGVFIGLYIVGTFFLWHLKDPLKIVGAILFGAYISTALIYIAEIANAYIFFNISHVLGKDFVERSLRGRFKKLYSKIENMNMGWVFLLRMIPLIPYRILDLSFGLSKFPFRKYIVIVLLASPVRIFWIQFILAAIKGFSPEAMMEYFMNNQAVLFWSFLYMAFSAIAAFLLKRKWDKA